MSILKFLSHLRQLGIEIQVDGKNLQVRAPKGVLTEQLRVDILARKAELLALLATKNVSDQTSRPTICSISREDHLPLSFAQERLWFLDQFEKDNTIYNVFNGVCIRGSLDIANLEKSLTEIQRRHEILRTTFSTVDGQPVQVIHPPLPFKTSVINLESVPYHERHARARQLADEEAGQPFDLTTGPLWRVNLLKLSATEHILLLTMHHIISDGWSLDILVHELTELYQAFLAGRPSLLSELPIQYADFASWQRHRLQGPLLTEQLSYWKQQLGNAAPLFELPTDHPRPAKQTFRGASQSFRLSGTLRDRLHQLSVREGCSLFMTLLAAFKVLLFRYTHQQDILVGSPIANREQPESHGLIGLFLNTLVFRTDLSGNPRFCDLLQRVRTMALDAYAHQDLPFEQLVDELQPQRNLSHHPLFQIMFTLESAPRIGAQSSSLGLTLSPFNIESSTAKFDLTMFVKETDCGLLGKIEYNTDLFKEATISRMIDHFQTLLEGIVIAPKQQITFLPLLSQAEKRLILTVWNQTKTLYPQVQGVHHLFEIQAEQSPESVAVIYKDQQLTYRQLNERANQLAHQLRSHGVGPGALIGICMERGLEMTVGVLAVLKAGGAYVPLDPAYPRERLALMITDSRVSVLITQQNLLDRLPASKCEQVIALDTSWADLTGLDQRNPTNGISPDDLAYVIYTSGSTGKPKGVAMPHRSLINLISWQIQQLVSAASTKTLQFASLNFDVSFQEMFSTWCAGGTLVLISETSRRNLMALANLLTEQKIERLFLPFIALQQLAVIITERGPLPPALREIITAGEQLQVTPALALLMKSLPGCRLINQYGPSESHVVTTYPLLGKPDEWPTLPPIGRPIGNTQLYILDAALQPVPVGICGELYIAGTSLAQGYLRCPALTAEQFLPNPFAPEPGGRMYKTGDIARYLPDGNIEFLGRIDRQIKIRGHRVELAEIEAILTQHDAIEASAVVTQADNFGGKRLIAYLAPKTGQTPTIPGIRAFASARLPDYMLPAAFILLENLPLTPSGKVNRRALPAAQPVRPEMKKNYVAPRNDIEEKLSKIWEEVLEIQPVGVTDNFFELGGNSLLAVRLFAKIEKTLKTNLPLATLFRSATIESLAEIAQQELGQDTWSSLVEIQPVGSKPPLFCVHGGTGDVLWFRELAHYLGPDQPFYGLQARGLDGIQQPLKRVYDMAAHYLKEIRALQPKGPYYLAGYCFGGVVAFEMAQQLQAQGEKVAFLATLSTTISPSGYRFRLGSVEFILNFTKNIPYWFINLWEIGPRLIVARIRRRLRVLKKMRGSTDFEFDAADIIDDVANLSEHRRKIIELNDKAAIAYVPQPFQGHIVDFQPRIPPLFHVPDRESSWLDIAIEGVSVKIVPGSHQSIFKEPRVQILAKEMKNSLCQAQKRVALSAKNAIDPSQSLQGQEHLTGSKHAPPSPYVSLPQCQKSS